MEHPEKGKVVRLMFQLYVTGEYSVESLREAIFTQTGAKISKGHIHMMLQCRFYIGQFVWRGVEYKGKHPHLVDHKTFARAQELISGRNGADPNRASTLSHLPSWFTARKMGVCSRPNWRRVNTPTTIAASARGGTRFPGCRRQSCPRCSAMLSRRFVSQRKWQPAS